MRRLLRITSRAKHAKITVAVVSLGVVVAAGVASYGGHSYVVRPGDTLWAISRANGITVSQLAAANNMNPNDILAIGRDLYIPRSGSSPSVGGSPGRSANPRTFCASFVPSGGPVGVLPQLLADSPSRLALQPLYVKWANYYGLSLPLLEAIGWQESGWQQNVVSSVGAVGAGQIMPGTAAFISRYLIGRPMNIHSVSDNIRMSAAFLAFLADTEGNNRCETIAAYYEGPLNLAQYGVFPVSQSYVASVEALIPRFE